MKKERVLVVDDEPIVRKLVKRIVEKSGYEVDSFADATSAIKAMRTRDYPLVISDIKMPEKDGIWLLKEIKKEFPDTQVVMLTASDDLEDAIACLNYGAERYLLKPFNVNIILPL